jgi:TP901 family phage tail tape measure protein
VPAYNVSTKFNGVDKVTPVFRKMAFSADKFSKKAKSSIGSIAGGTLIASGVSRGLGLVTQGVGSLARGFVEFDDAIVSAGAKFKDVNLATEEGRKKMDELRKSAKLAGQETVFSTSESAKGLEFLAMAGFSSAQAMASLNTIQNLAIATNSEFAQAADFSSDLLGAFGLASKDAAVQAENYTRLNDVLTKTANSANVSLEDMFETMKVAGPISKAYGASLEEVSAITGVLGNAGIKGSMGATALKNIMLRLAAPTKQAQGALDMLGVKTDDAGGNMRKVTDILQEIGEKTKNLGSKKKLEAMNALFGKIPIAAATNLADSIGSIKELEKALEGAGGTAKLTAEQMSKSLGNRLKSLGSAVEAFAFKFFSAFAKDGADGITRLTNAIKAFDPTPIINGLRIAFKIISDLMPIIKIVIPLWAAWTIAQWALNVAMTANPMGLMIAGVAALVIGATLLVKNWGAVKNFFIGLIPVFRQVGQYIFNFLLAPTKALLFLLSKIPGVGGLAQSALDQIDSIGDKIGGTQEAVNQEQAPNAAKEDGRRALSGEGTLTVRAEKGTEVTKSDSDGLNGVNMVLAGAN